MKPIIANDRLKCKAIRVVFWRLSVIIYLITREAEIPEGYLDPIGKELRAKYAAVLRNYADRLDFPESQDLVQITSAKPTVASAEPAPQPQTRRKSTKSSKSPAQR